MSRKAFDKSAPEDLLKILDFYGIEVFDNGDTQFKPRTMDKFRKAQHDKEVDRLRREVEILEPCVREYYLRNQPEAIKAVQELEKVRGEK